MADALPKPFRGAAARRLVSPIMADLVASKDWARTSLGPAHTWPLELRTILDVVLDSRFPMVFWWGDDLVQFYNDAYLPIIGDKHPAALGQTAAACWAEIWDAIGPQITAIHTGGPATWNEDVLLDINRHGFIGESYFTWSYSPLTYPPAPNGVGGVLCTVQETTEKVIGERRILLLRDLAAYGTESRSADEQCHAAAATIARYPRSVPFALIYLWDQDWKTARLAAASGVDLDNTQFAPREIAIGEGERSRWPLHAVRETESLVHIESLNEFGPLPPGPWPEPPREAVIVPIASEFAHEPAGFLVAGVNPRERFDGRYGSFYELMSGQIASAISSARAYENERKRAEALAELDRAKIDFFANISHEFRTPLTLMLGPLSELQKSAGSRDMPLIDTAYRNALRLLKLVNTLLEFSRLEAGRSDAAYVETDLASMTLDLCGLFRSAVENAGLRFLVEIELSEPAFVDRSMWEMIVLNLLSNALKYTHAGEIGMTLRAVNGAVVLCVRDTGIGIPAADLPFVFERFRRVRGAKSRSHEGSGIGLALVDELVRLHGGSIDVESEIGTGSAFTVRIPLGHAHLDPTRVTTGERLTAHASVVDQYLADVRSTIVRDDSLPPATDVGANAARILLADDNADLRAYLTRILAARHAVVTVRNGVEALARLREEHFDLVVSDVMMPEMDGFELVRQIRSDPALAATPFIMLSARASNGSAIEGLTHGADDYLVKPFAAEELLARVYAQLNAASIRERATRDLRASEERFRTLAASMPHIVLEGDSQHGITFLSEAFTTYTGLPAESAYGVGWLAGVHPDDEPQARLRWARALDGASEYQSEFRLRRSDGVYRWHVARALAQPNATGTGARWTGTITDIHDMRRSVAEREFLAEASRILTQSLDLQTTLEGLARTTIPFFADWCQIDLATPQGGIRTAAIGHVDPEMDALAQAFVGKVHLNPDADRAAPYTLRTGRTDLITDVDAIAAPAVDDQGELEIYRRLGLGSAVCVPLVADGKTLGAISVNYGDSRRQYAADDIPVLEELGRRAGSAVQRANEFAREHRVAQSFQEASLPLSLPTLHAATFDAVYVPATNEIQVGGDWYDAVRLSDGRVVVSIGDVTGNGLGAAVTMGNMRQIIRGIAQVHADPALMLDAADRALQLEHPDKLVTAFVGVYDPITGRLAYASAGHPPPMLRRPDGSIELLSDGGLPLGLRHVSKSDGSSVALQPGSFLVLYTDGLTEASRRPADGEAQLYRLVRDGAIFESPHPAIALRDTFFDGITSDDDVAILILGIAGTTDDPARDGDGPIQRWFFDSSDASAGQSARRSFVDGLRRRLADDETIRCAEVVFGELIGNVVRYAPGRVEVTVDWSAASPVLHVLDNGPGFRHVPTLPRDVYSESGRGLFMISALSEDFSVSRRPDRGSHARAVLAPLRGAFRVPTGDRTSPAGHFS